MTEKRHQIKFVPEEAGQSIYAAQGAEENGQTVPDRPADGEEYGGHPEHNDPETASEIVAERKHRDSRKVLASVAAGVGAVVVGYWLYRGRRLPPFNHD